MLVLLFVAYDAWLFETPFIFILCVGQFFLNFSVKFMPCSKVYYCVSVIFLTINGSASRYNS